MTLGLLIQRCILFFFVQICFASDVTGNLGNMLFIIIPAICKERGSPFGDADACYRQGMAYSALSMAVWILPNSTNV